MSEPRVPFGGPAEPGEHGGAPAGIDSTTGQHRAHWILSEEERAKEFIRPVRDRYQHVRCGTVTTMPIPIAETYARQPSFYTSTFCCGCRSYFPVGRLGEFVWLGGPRYAGEPTSEKVGT